MEREPLCNRRFSFFALSFLLSAAGVVASLGMHINLNQSFVYMVVEVYISIQGGHHLIKWEMLHRYKVCRRGVSLHGIIYRYQAP